MGLFRRNRIRRPVDGFAEIVEAWAPREGGESGNCRMRLRLDVPGVAPVVVDHHELWMVENRWPEVGMRVAVTVDADRPERVDVHWESVFGEVLGGKLGVAAELLASAVNVELDLSQGTGGRGGPDPNQDTEALIAALNARHAAGEITYEEMTHELMKVLGADPPA